MKNWYKEYELKEGEVADFGCDGSFSVFVKNNKTYVKFDTSCVHGPSSKNYVHDCEECVFLGDLYSNGRSLDAYWCNQSGFPTVVARYGNEGSEYKSGRNSADDELKEIERIWSKHIEFLEK